MLKDVLKQGDWMCSIDLKDAYLLVSVAQEHLTISSFCVGQQDIRVYMPPLQVVQCSEDVYKTIKATFEQVYNLSGQHSNNEPTQTKITTAGGTDGQTRGFTIN